MKTQPLIRKGSSIIPGIIIVMVFLIVSAIAEGARGDSVEEERKRQMKEIAKQQLQNIACEIELTEISADKKKRKSKDTLRFENNKVESKRLASEGFSPTNFTISIKGENVVVWETMQTSEKKGLAFWRGEIDNGVMSGVLSRHLGKNEVQDYSFFGKSQAITFDFSQIKIAPSFFRKKEKKKVVEKPKETVKKEVVAEPKVVKEENVASSATVEEEEEEKGEDEVKEEPKKKGWWPFR